MAIDRGRYLEATGVRAARAGRGSRGGAAAAGGHAVLLPPPALRRRARAAPAAPARAAPARARPRRRPTLAHTVTRLTQPYHSRPPTFYLTTDS